MKRKLIAQRIRTQIDQVNRTIRDHDKARTYFLKDDDEASAAYHYGRISGLVDAITYLKVVLEQLEKKDHE